MQTTSRLVLFACGTFFLIALLAGIWKWQHMMKSATHQAPPYVDIAHRASLLYSFACLVLLKFVELSPLPSGVVFVAAALPIFFFAVTIGVYVSLGFRNHTDNQFSKRNATTTWGMALLAAGEVGGFALLFGSWMVTQ